MASIIARAEGGIRAFVSGMLPNFEKSRILEDLDSSIKELRLTREMYNVMTRDYINVLDKKFPALVTEFKRNVPSYKGDMFATLNDVMDSRLGDIDKIVEYVEHIYAKVVMRDVLDYQKINMLRYVEGLAFFTVYARKLIIAATNYRIDDPSVVAAIDRMDLEFLSSTKNIRSFAIMTAAMSHSAKDLRKAMDKMAKITFDPDTHELALKSNRNVDALRLGMMPGVGTIVYHVGLAINLYHSRRQELAREEREKLQIQVLLLRKKAEGTGDSDEVAKLEKQIKYYNNRISKLTFALEDMAED